MRLKQQLNETTKQQDSGEGVIFFLSSSHPLHGDVIVPNGKKSEAGDETGICHAATLLHLIQCPCFGIKEHFG